MPQINEANDSRTNANIEWNFKKQDENIVSSLSKELNINSMTTRVLINRGYDTKEKMTKFLTKPSDILHDPFLMLDMDKAVERLNRAKLHGEKIMIYGDYDVDGISATCAIYFFLKRLEFDVCYYIPDRFEEGYGINKDALDKACANKINLIVTVDTGITAAEEAEYAKTIGIDIIVTDHHDCPQVLPDVCAVVNPKRADSGYPFKELAGVGVAFKLICAYNQRYNNNFSDRILFDEYFEFAAMGTIADIMPLTDENRVLTYIGLKSMRDSKNHGIQAILDCCYKSKSDREKEDKNKIVPAETVSYGIAPRINAAGRLDKASKAVELFMSANAEAAEMMADELSNLNRQRQQTEKDIFAQAVEKMCEDGNKDCGNKIKVLYHEQWNQGVIGIVASKLADKYDKAIVLLTKDSDNICKGSCRSVKNINITEALKACSDVLIKYGGHELAAGLTVEHKNIEELSKRLNEYVDINNINIEKTKVYDIDCEIGIETINLKCVNELSMLEPFGVGNPVPVFGICGCEIASVIPIGDNRHIKLILKSNDITFEALNFNVEPHNFKFGEGDCIDIICNIGINSFLGKESVQYIVRDIRYNKAYTENYIKSAENYKKFYLDEKTELDKSNIPDREDFKAVYIFLLKMLPKAKTCTINSDIYRFKKKFGSACKSEISYFKFRIILDIFSETNILNIDYLDENNIRSIKINIMQEKIDLENTEIYKRLNFLFEKREFQDASRQNKDSQN